MCLTIRLLTRYLNRWRVYFSFYEGVTMLCKICRFCGAKVPVDQECTCKAAQKNKKDRWTEFKNRKYARNKDHTFYNSIQWSRTRDYIKQKACGLDEYVLATTGTAEAGEMVHHIIPLDERPDLRLEPTNLILVSRETHEWIHRVYRTKQKQNLIHLLQSIARTRQAMP